MNSKAKLRSCAEPPADPTVNGMLVVSVSLDGQLFLVFRNEHGKLTDVTADYEFRAMALDIPDDPMDLVVGFHVGKRQRKV